MESLLFLVSKPTVFIFSLILILVRQRSLSQYLLSTFMNWSPDLVFLALDVLDEVAVGEAELSSLDALLHRLFDLENVHALLGRGAGQDVLAGVEHDTGDFGLAIAPLQLLNHFPSVSAVDLNDVASLGCGGNEGAVGVDCHGSYFGVVSRNDEVDTLINHIVEDLERALLLRRQADDLGNGLLGLRYGAEAEGVGVSVDLLDELERDEVEDEGLLLEDDDHHVLAQLDVHDELVGVEGDLRPVLLLVVVPDHHLVLLLFVDQHDHVRLVHHLHEGDVLLQVLHLLLQLRAPRVVLQDLESVLCRDCKIFLGLVRRHAVDGRGRVQGFVLHPHRCILLLESFEVRLLVLVDDLLIDDTLFGGHDVT
eukprot:CAMPEP_0168612802 /NCGR_PEP_ID=MMETSP0449_2-20121227/3110_1 /TAXON_ID=1082188 /ORGANISM="Strombidium rassoulzadegani, Strain ras09" /LENGTH=365 /DNA_ID=CAMNT_0008653389 /DNA_START=169 /DNA_END=1265 /DNA_ORIENTATION=-